MAQGSGNFSDFHSCVIRLRGTSVMPCINAQNTKSIKSCGNEECDKCRSGKCVGIESGWAVQIIFVLKNKLNYLKK